MIDPKRRLLKLLRTCQTYQEFFGEAVKRSSWVLAPYVQAGHVVNKPWLENFWKTHKAEAV